MSSTHCARSLELSESTRTTPVELIIYSDFV